MFDDRRATAVMFLVGAAIAGLGAWLTYGEPSPIMWKVFVSVAVGSLALAGVNIGRYEIEQIFRDRE